MGVIYDRYKSYSPGFLGVGALGVLGALILSAISIVPRHNNNNGEKEQDGQNAKETKKDNTRKTELKKVKAQETESKKAKESKEEKSGRAESEEDKVSQRRL